MKLADLLTCVSVTALLAVATPALAQAPAKAAPKDAAATSDIDEVVVTGSRLQASGFSAPTPVTVVGSETLERRASATVGETLAEIPAFRLGVGATQGTGGTFQTGQALLDLRGLGVARTLVLIDGRRHVPNLTNGAFDTNMIPVSLIDRTEVVTGGASAAYGSDAVAGVVNFIINERLEGLKGSVQYGQSQRNDNNEVLVSAGYGMKFAGGKGHVIIGADFSHAEPAEGVYSRGWGRKESNLLSLTTARAAGLPAFLITDNVHSTIAPGGLINGCIQRGVLRNGVACPVGNLTFNDDGTSRPFVFGSPVGSTAMVGGDNYGFQPGRNQYLRVGGERYAVMGRANYEIAPDTTVFGEFSLGRFEVESRTSDQAINNSILLVNRDNPFIPAALAAQMDANGITQLQMNKVLFANREGVTVANRNKFREGVVGARGTIFGDWKWDAAFTDGRGDFSYRPEGLVLASNLYAALYAVAGPNGPVCGPLASNPMYVLRTSPAQRDLLDPGCAPINPFGPNNVSQAAYDYIAPEVVQDVVYKRRTAQANLAGSPFSVPAGPVSVAVGAEWRDESVLVSLSPRNELRSKASAFTSANPQPGAGAVEVYEGYAEVGVPLLRDMAFAKSLDVNAAVRRTHYSSSGSVTTWKLGGVWEPTDFLRVRATRSRDIRAPNLPELYFRGNDGFTTQTNPRTGISSAVNSAALNNPNLHPEQANTWTAGVVFQPEDEILNGLRVSVDYYRIEIKDVIAAIPVGTVIQRYFSNNFPDYAQYFTFDNSPVGFSRVDSPLLNLNSQKTDGVDIEAAYTMSLDRFNAPGRLSLSAVGSWLDDLDTLDQSGASLGDIAGAIPTWRWTGNINYALDKLNVNLQARYFSSFKYRIDRIGPNDPTYNPAAANSINKNTFPALVYWSLAANYQILDEPDRKLKVFGVVDNLFDKDPPSGSFGALGVLGNGGSGGYNPYDNIGRNFKVGLRFEY